MIWQSLRAVYWKEMLEVFRDRRTLISMVIVPVLVFPLLFSVVGRFMTRRSEDASREATIVAVSGRVPDGFIKALRESGLEAIVKDNLSAAVEGKQAAAGIDVAASSTPGIIIIYSDGTREASRIASERVKGALNAVKIRMLRQRLESAGLPVALAEPLDIRGINVASQRKMAGFMVGSLMGYMMILLMFTAAMYPAIDMTAGEKERRTLEALLSSGASRDGIMLGKILAASTASLLTGILTLVSLMYSVRNLLPRDAARQLSQVNLLEPSTVALVIVTILPISLLASSSMLAISLFARSYKEGQSYVTPVLMLVIFPAVLGMLPGFELTPALSLIPIFNVSQMVKEVFLGSFSALAFWVTFVANTVYALAAFSIATATFRRESVLFRT